MEPAKHIILTLGGASAVARELNLHRATVYKWMEPRSRGGQNGQIPMKRVSALMKMSDRLGAGLTFDDFMPVEMRINQP